MKKIYITLIAVLLVCQISFAQWNPGTGTGSGNYTLTSGNAGIATFNPTFTLTLGSPNTGFANYNTADQTTNTEVLRQYWQSNVFNILSQATGTGVIRPILIGNANSSTTVSQNGIRVNPSGLNVQNGETTLGVSGTIVGSGSQGNGLGIFPTIGQSGIASYRALWISPNESSVGSGARYLIDAGTNTGINGTGVHTSVFTLSDAGTAYFSGNVGFGTTTPRTSLDVGGGVQISGAIGTTPSPGLSFGLFPYQGVGLGIYSAATSSNQGIGIWTDLGGVPMEAIRILAGGNMLIGKTTQTNPIYKLDVAGSARANSITVNTNGADFVFEPTYKLFSLIEVENYIKANHHLPEIPSAKEMQANGLNLGDNATKLLQKVEELTLYTITSDKKIKEDEMIMAQQQTLLLELQKQLKDQQKEIDQLKNKQ